MIISVGFPPPKYIYIYIYLLNSKGEQSSGYSEWMSMGGAYPFLHLYLGKRMLLVSKAYPQCKQGGGLLPFNPERGGKNNREFKSADALDVRKARKKFVYIL